MNHSPALPEQIQRTRHMAQTLLNRLEIEIEEVPNAAAWCTQENGLPVWDTKESQLGALTKLVQLLGKIDQLEEKATARQPVEQSDDEDRTTGLAILARFVERCGGELPANLTDT